MYALTAHTACVAVLLLLLVAMLVRARPPPHRHNPCRPYKDSKTLTEERRAVLFATLRRDERCAYATDVISAAEISAQMLSRCVGVLQAAPGARG